MIAKLRAAAFLLVVALSAGTLTPRMASAQDESTGAEISPDSLRSLVAAAAQGHAVAQYNLGVMYGTGDGVPENNAEAVRWYRAAAEQGLAYVQSLLGDMYADGLGVREDDVEAVHWYRAAAEQGWASDQYNLGLMYANGEGVPENQVMAYAWINLAAAQGYGNSQEVKDSLSQKMTNEQVAQAQALSLELLERINGPR